MQGRNEEQKTGNPDLALRDSIKQGAVSAPVRELERVEDVTAQLEDLKVRVEQLWGYL